MLQVLLGASANFTVINKLSSWMERVAEIGAEFASCTSQRIFLKKWQRDYLSAVARLRKESLILSTDTLAWACNAIPQFTSSKTSTSHSKVNAKPRLLRWLKE